ncbi:alpha-glucosidase [Dysgonomonas sp. PFB1-18]|uniref:glycoside hydrolase family 97 protein n=1 Tax=unclassified Dysgonomonas TaxID=2630389 RepID=UPI002474694F|nr:MULTISPECIES: glycoside hydrolase family 97 protein [unclassified Dysgonomonas]MDH6310445.1 alpha-glucosidase [Dysgonomonas sp. PF1-14]MDH6340756.1 alpha-glucosidase [Dysgonomonas sp. PF1-16]MDH6382376.1 alpha-glucosidase [Dysgonomonas sp. PFB1-18]MDH6399723.1 alpha-glucosidase [Dysgonomonas sp. PF1-23]
MKRNHLIWSLLSILICCSMTITAQKQFSLKSPDGKLEASIVVDKTVEYSVSHQGDLMLAKSPLSMTLADGTSYGVAPKLSGSATAKVDKQIESPVYKRKQVADNYNELTLKFKGDYNIVFRAYNDGVAYRFVSTSKKPFVVENEQAVFNFPSDSKAFVNYANRPEGTLESQYMNSFEQPYHHISLSEWNKKRLGISPLVVEGVNGKKVCIAEADLINYPGMFLYPADGTASLKGIFAPYPKDIQQGGHNMLQGLVKSRESYIAKFDGATSFPWRIVVVSANDAELADSDMVYKLATPAQGDYSWVKPGKVAWEWWNTWNLYGVDFETGVNNATYKYYIDFASKYGIEYVILDEGWAVNLQADLLQVVPEIDLKELVAYANKKNVGLILWAGYYAFNKDIEGICKHYHEMGIKGFKVDFMDRDDQPMVDFHRRAAEIGAKYKMLMDFHGSYKPTGLQRTYPNVINFEGVNGLEQMKWSGSELDQVTYDVTMPFIRMLAGPIDYTQGAMRNATKGNYRSVYSEAMSQGTRCRQLAEYVIFESPLNMLCDSPSNYEREEECTGFIATVPTVWDNTIALNGEIGKYVTIARQKGDTWYVGSMTNWDSRKMELDLSFLGEGSFKGEVFKDGVNANKVARDYKREVITIPSDKKLPISMASGGGYVIKITRQ